MRRKQRLLLVGAIVVWSSAIIIQLALGLPLGHDEAAYAVDARRLLAGDPPLWIYRSIGVELLALPGVVLGGGETALRIPAATLSLLVPIGGYALARAVYPTHAIAGWVALVLAGGHPMLLRAASLLGDLPSAGALL